MILHALLIITPRLMPGLKIGNGFISLGNGPRNSEGRTVYGCFIDLPDGTEHEITDLRSGCGGGSIQDGLANLLGFLGAATESRQYRERTGRDGENESLFDPAIVDWASENSDEISMLACELEETPNLVEE